MSELTTIKKLIEERLAALVEAVVNQEAKVRRLENTYKATSSARHGRHRAYRRLVNARLILERLRGRAEEAEKTWILIKAHANAKDGPNE